METYSEVNEMELTVHQSKKANITRRAKRSNKENVLYLSPNLDIVT